MTLDLEQALTEVWPQAFVENPKSVELGTKRFPVRRTPKRRLRQVDFVFEGNEIRGWNRTPRPNPGGRRWRGLARKVMRFLSEGRYVANVVDGKVTLYGR
jgi:hypothetical protein